MTKVVISTCHGGFGLSRKAFLALRESGCEFAMKEPDYGEYWPDGSGPRGACLGDNFCTDIDREDTILVRVVELLGRSANGWAACLSVVEIPDGIEWQIDEYDGAEWVAEKHRRWS